MKTKIISFLAIALAFMAGMSSCDEKWEPAVNKEGTIALKSIGVEVSSAMEVISRAEYDLSGFLVTIYDTNGDQVQQWTYGTMPEIFTLPVGSYRVDVTSHQVQKAEWEKPLFKGSKTFSIENEKITEIGIVKCTFQSLKVTIKFTDELRALMESDVKVTVVANDDGRLTFTPDETRAGYFEVIDGSNTLAARFTGTVKGYAEDFAKVYTDIAAGQHRIITFDVKDNSDIPAGETGNIDPTNGIYVDVTVEDENLSGSINPEEDNEDSSNRPGDENFGDEPGPGPDDPDNPDNPDDPDTPIATFKAEELSFDQPNTPVDGMDGLVTITVPAGVAHLLVEIGTTSADFRQTIAELGITSFDLAYPGDMKATLESLDLPTGENVINQTEIPFDITQFIGLLNIYPGTHDFRITVTDNNNKQCAKTLTFIAQ